MNRTRIEENLLILLDPYGQCGDHNWRFIRSNGLTGSEKSHNVVYCFKRQHLLSYLLCLLLVKLKKKRAKVRKTLYVNDGLLCCLFSADNAAGYRAFTQRHVPSPAGIRRRLSLLLPLLLRAEQMFISVEHQPYVGQPHDRTMLDDLDIMFYSNAPGKLLLTNAATFVSGKGMIFKTTSSPDYAANLEHEYETVATVSKGLRRAGLVPAIAERYNVNSRLYYPEAYLSGENLRSKLRSLGQAAAYREAVDLLELLDGWYNNYRTAFAGAKKSLYTLYEPVLADFSRWNTDRPEVAPIMGLLQALLAGMDAAHEGIVPVTAHNDLWPGNFIVTGDRLTAVDWERATPESAPIFDYFWMIISATMEYLVGQNGVQDYSNAFRQFLSQEDEVCSHARTRLEKFLENLGFARIMRPRFILLFLLEWSIQGARALGAQTDMDRLAQGELMAYVGNPPAGLDLELSAGPAGTAQL